MNVDHHLMSGVFEPIMKSRKSYQRVYVDLPGMGESTWEEGRFEDAYLVEVLLEFVKKIFKGKQFIIAGESYGGHLSRCIIERISSQIIGAIFLCPCIVEEKNMPQRQRMVMDESFWEGLGQAEQQEYDFCAAIYNNEVYERFKRDIKPYMPLANQQFLSKLSSTLHCDLGKKYDFPVVFIEARQDNFVGYEAAFALLKCFPHACYAVIDCAGHNLQIERVMIFEAMVKEFLQRFEHRESEQDI